MPTSWLLSPIGKRRPSQRGSKHSPPVRQALQAGLWGTRAGQTAPWQRWPSLCPGSGPGCPGSQCQAPPRRSRLKEHGTPGGRRRHCLGCLCSASFKREGQIGRNEPKLGQRRRHGENRAQPDARLLPHRGLASLARVGGGGRRLPLWLLWALPELAPPSFMDVVGSTCWGTAEEALPRQGWR